LSAFCAAICCCVATTSSIADDLSRAIDGLVEKGFSAHGVERAADPADDYEFFRRARLDLTGIIPTVDEVRAFAADRSADKHERLIDRLIAGDECAVHLASVFDVMWMERRPDEHIPSDDWRAYLAESFRRNKPLDLLVREILSSDGTEPATRPAAKFILDREAAHDLLVRDIGRLFLGVDLQCAQCHDHPTVEDYRHRHYYGLHVFVAGTKLYRVPGAGGNTQLQEEAVREATFASVFAPEVQNKTGPRIMDGPALEIPEYKKGEEYVEKPSSKTRGVPKFSLREALSQSLPRAETREFARNMANRLWAHLMGRGVVHPLDMHHQGNPPTNPELLDALTDGLIAAKFDARQFLRRLAQTRTYRRSSLAPIDVDADVIPEASYAVAILKPLNPEQLFASFVRATGNEVTLEREIDAVLKAAESPAPKSAATADVEQAAATPPSDAAAKQKARAAERAKRVKAFADLFGSTPGSAEGEFQASLTQALFLANAPSVSTWLAPQHHNLAERLIAERSPAAVAEAAYLAILSRPAAAEETTVVAELLGQTPDRATAIGQLIWSLVASAEFRLNH
jgi:hypothetical protein